MATGYKHGPSIYPASVLAHSGVREENGDGAARHHPRPFLSGKIHKDMCLPDGKIRFSYVVSPYMESTEYLCVFLMQ